MTIRTQEYEIFREQKQKKNQDLLEQEAFLHDELTGTEIKSIFSMNIIFFSAWHFHEYHSIAFGSLLMMT